jgi:hypothetical protein
METVTMWRCVATGAETSRKLCLICGRGCAPTKSEYTLIPANSVVVPVERLKPFLIPNRGCQVPEEFSPPYDGVHCTLPVPDEHEEYCRACVLAYLTANDGEGEGDGD